MKPFWKRGEREKSTLELMRDTRKEQEGFIDRMERRAIAGLDEGARVHAIDKGLPVPDPLPLGTMHKTYDAYLPLGLHMFSECESCGKRLRMPYGREEPGEPELRSISVPFCWCKPGPNPSGIRIVLAPPEAEVDE